MTNEEECVIREAITAWAPLIASRRTASGPSYHLRQIRRICSSSFARSRSSTMQHPPASHSVTEEAALHSLSTKQLKELLGSSGVDYSGCVEKGELVALASRHNLQDKAADVALHKVPTCPLSSANLGRTI